LFSYGGNENGRFAFLQTLNNIKLVQQHLDNSDIQHISTTRKIYRRTWSKHTQYIILWNHSFWHL